MNYQEHLYQQAKWILENTNQPSLRGVIGKWNAENEAVCLSYYYFDGKPSEEQIEEASVVSVEIIATFPLGLLEENYIRLDYPQPPPESDFWAFRKQ